MIIDVTGITLMPGNCGKDCMGNGMHPPAECCCDECDYLLCCLESHRAEDCIDCTDRHCPHAGKPS